MTCMRGLQLQGEQDKLHAVRASQQFSSNVVVAGSSVTATAATSA